MSFIAPLSQAINSVKPILAIGSQIAGGIVTAAGQRQVYGGASNVMNYNASVMNQNADQIAQSAAQTKIINEKKKRSYLSSITANYGARGVTLSGSPLLVLAESAAALELDIQNTEFNSLIEANRARSQATTYGIEADNYKSAGRAARQNTLISTSYKIASEY